MLNASEKRFFGADDSETIQNAVDEAERTGSGMVVIPKRNERTGENVWNISKAILLPSNITIFLEGAYMRLTDDAVDNVFRNKNNASPTGLYPGDSGFHADESDVGEITDDFNAAEQIGRTLEGEQENIRIIGDGNATLDGGKMNDYCEQFFRDHLGAYPYTMGPQLMINFHNVRNFEVGNIRFVDTRWWALRFMFCRWGRIHDLDFRNYGTTENQDGINLRVGCEFITIENITGFTGDDTVALTGLPCGMMESHMAVRGKSVDIHDVTIRNIISSVHACSLIRFLCADGCREYNITVDGVKDTGLSICGSAIQLGASSTSFVRKEARDFDGFQNIVIRNVESRGICGVYMREKMRNVTVENVNCCGEFSRYTMMFTKNFECKGLTLRNISHTGYPVHKEGYQNTVFYVTPNEDAVRNNILIDGVYAENVDHVFMLSELPAEHVRTEDLKKEFFVAEKPVDILNSYCRYFKVFYGKEPDKRPEGNRFENVGPDNPFLVENEKKGIFYH